MLFKIKNIISFALILIFASNYAFAQKPSDLIKEVVDEASRILSSSDPVEAKIINLNDLAENNVDINRIAKYTLGKHRKTISDEKINKYFKLYKKYFLKNFSSRLIDYTNPEIIIVDENIINENFTIVNTILEATSKNPELKISWRVITKNPNKPLILDLLIEGLSLAKAQKEEFNSIIKNNDGEINALFKVMEEYIIK
jgi:phospholipid transport system substrate-binding protein